MVCGERVMEREILSNNTEYQERLREGRIKGLLGDRANTMMEELMMVSDQESRQLQQQVSVVRSHIVVCAMSELLFPSSATGE